MREALQRLSAKPHNVGTAYDRDNAEWLLAQFKSYGLDAQIETFDVLYPTPLERSVEMVAPTHFVAKPSTSRAVAGDPTSAQQANSSRRTTRTRSTAMSPRRSST